MISFTTVPANNSIPTPDFNNVFAAMGGNGVAFGNIFSQAMAQAQTPGQAAQIDWLQAQYSDLMDLSTMGSGTSAASLSGLGGSNVFGLGGPLGLPAWTQDVTRLLGNNSDAQQLMNAYQSAAFQMQSQFNQSLSNFGDTGSSVNSLI